MNNTDLQAPQLLDFLDYREFLNTWVHHRKKIKQGFSLRSLSLRLGLSSTSFLSAVIKGKKNLSDDLRHRLLTVLCLDENEQEYFHLLVQFNQAKGMEHQNVLFQQLQRFRGSRAHLLSQGQYRLYHQWYYVAVWNYIGLYPQQIHPGQIAASLQPRVTPEQVQEAIQVLMELGLIRRIANGYEICQTHLTTQSDVSSLAARNHTQELLSIAKELMDQVKPQDRQYNTLMFQVSPQGLQTVKKRVRQFQEELRDILDHDQGEDRIYTLVMALFPHSVLSSSPKSKESSL